MKPEALNLETVRQAHARIAGGLRATPSAVSRPLSELAGMGIILKHDYQQSTGSFKERGARNALLSLSPSERARGVVAASAGNHALGLAYHGAQLGISVTVVMPLNAPRVKADRCRQLGAHVLQHGATYDESASFAENLATQTGATYVHPFDDLTVIAGQATLALEALFAFPDADAFVVPVGGGGLLAGVATVVKALRPDALVIGVEPAHAPGLAVALHAGKPVRVPVSTSLADGLAVAKTGATTFAIAQQLVDRVVTVTEDELAAAVLHLHDTENTVVEGAGAAGLAACLAGKLPELARKQVVVPLTGRNIDPLVHARALSRARSVSLAA
ncbi:threonine ammonia-lyase [Nibricoccus aquaticus]|uniref:Threonine ammonia-lyase n=1 Tax=Nibricoccus aquaticus TaxID=2576891 RepID=A0A290QDJ6_9BACT|nr:threonine/serine dehydratase [Nibricoccus aquaticus]ATC64326.1 threonine ammonia-lyase [Nibricoccus aquaticus]